MSDRPGRRTLRAALVFGIAYALPLALAKAHVHRAIDMALWAAGGELDALFRIAADTLSSAYGAALVVATGE